MAIVDPDTMVRAALGFLVPDLEVVAAESHLEPLLTHRPALDVLILELWLQRGRCPVMHGRQAVTTATAAGFRVLIYTNESRPMVLAGCLAAGAHGIVDKSAPVEDLRTALDAVAAGEIVVSDSLVGLTQAVQQRGELPRLSPRQLAVLKGRARGESFRSIAGRLYISPKTAEGYMGDIGRAFAEFLRDHSPADLERFLGIGDGDLMAPP